MNELNRRTLPSGPRSSTITGAVLMIASLNSCSWRSSISARRRSVMSVTSAMMMWAGVPISSGRSDTHLRTHTGRPLLWTYRFSTSKNDTSPARRRRSSARLASRSSG